MIELACLLVFDLVNVLQIGVIMHALLQISVIAIDHSRVVVS